MAVAGAHNIRNAETSQQSVRAVFVNHEQYNSNTISNDIAVLNFQGSFELNSYVQPINMPTAATGEWMTG
jgi:hypothetical protein